MSNAKAGTITRIYTDTIRTLFRLDGSTGPVPKDGYYELRLTHPNYNAIFSLGLASAAGRTRVTIRTDDSLNASENAVITYMVADY